MGEIAASGARGPARCAWRRFREILDRPGILAGIGSGGFVRAAAAVLLCWLVAACTPKYDWRDARAPGGEYWVQLPAKPATMTRGIHLESLEVDMTMQGARVDDDAFTVAIVPLPAQAADAGGLSPERMLAAMREQMLRNIGAPETSPPQPATVAVVDAEGRKAGTTEWQGITARGTGRHATMALHGRFGLWRGHAMQIVAVGPALDQEQATYFLDSLRLVAR